MIRLEELNCTFHAGTPNAKTVIRDLNLTVDAGEFVTIIGSNGAGKTTLFNLITGNLSPTSGKVFIKDRDVTGHPEYHRARTMGRIFQDPGGKALDPDLRVISVSQEHGIVNRALAVASKLRILPNHSCLTVACFDEYQVVRGDTVVDRWKIWRGR